MNAYTYSLLVCVLIPAAALADPKADGELRITPTLKWAAGVSEVEKKFNDLQLPMAGRLVLVTIRIDNKLYLQTELTIQREAKWFKSIKVPAGTCEVAFQGEGLKMIIKRGINVSADSWTQVDADLIAGQGLLVLDELDIDADDLLAQR